MVQQFKVRKDADKLTEFINELESLIEGDDAYGSNVNLLSFNTETNGDIAGKFQDNWNNRVFSYSVEKNRIGYKPSIALDRIGKTDSAIDAKLFDIFSLGYSSLQVKKDAAGIGKKPRCTAISYGCGKICLSLKNTCWINSVGQKVNKAGGAVASISQGRIDKLRTLAQYLAANGNNKWSKYGGAELLAAKAGNLEAKRANLFARNTVNQASSKLPAVKTIQEKTLETKNLEESKEKKVTKLPKAIPETITYDPNGLSNPDFRIIGNTEVRAKLDQWDNAFNEIKSLEYDPRTFAAIGVINTMTDMKNNKKAMFGGVVDSDGKLQSAYTIKPTPTGYFIDYLVSAPWNCLTDHPNKKIGAGAGAIEGLVKAAKSEGKEGTIDLQTLPNAILFYEKVGFKFKGKKENMKMKLSADDAMIFIQSQERKYKKDSDYQLESLENLEDKVLGLFSVPQDIYEKLEKLQKKLE